jgi:hypothetical protein
VIVPELEFFEVKREPLRRDAVVLVKPLFGEAPEALEAVDVNAAPGEALGVIDLEVAIATEHETVVGTESIGVNDAASAYGFDREVEQGFSANIGDRLDPDTAGPLQNAEDRDFSRCTSTTFSLTPATEVGLVQLHFFTQKFFPILGVAENGPAQNRDGLVGGLVADPELSGHLPGRDLKLEKLDHPEPLRAGQSALVDPPSGQLTKGVIASAATTPPVRQTVQFSAQTTGTKPVPQFEAELRHIFPCRGLT